MRASDSMRLVPVAPTFLASTLSGFLTGFREELDDLFVRFALEQLPLPIPNAPNELNGVDVSLRALHLIKGQEGLFCAIVPALAVGPFTIDVAAPRAANAASTRKAS